MNRDEIKLELNQIMKHLFDLDCSRLDHDTTLRDQYDLDSFDWLELMTHIKRKFKIQIEARDFLQCSTINGIVTFIQNADKKN